MFQELFNGLTFMVFHRAPSSGPKSGSLILFIELVSFLFVCLCFYYDYDSLAQLLLWLQPLVLYRVAGIYQFQGKP